MSEEEFIQKLIERIAYTAISRSSLRKQGAPGVIQASRDFLRKINLRRVVSSFNSGRYLELINSMTQKLSQCYKKGAKGNYGAARKAINLFMRDVFYNKIFIQYYRIRQNKKLYDQLELPLDSYTIRHLLNIKPELKSIWNGIKNLQEESNSIFQELAMQSAKRIRIKRVELDILWWRNAIIKK